MGDEKRALYSPYYRGFEPRLGAAWTATDRLVVRGGYGITQFMEGTGANLRLPLNPPFFFESAVNYDTTTGAGTARTGFAEWCRARRRAERACLRSRSAPAIHAAVERLRRVPADAGDVGAGRLCRPPRRSPGHAGRRQPGAAGRRRPSDVGAEEYPSPALQRVTARDHHCDDGGAIGQPLSRDAGERPPATSNGVEFLASYTLGKTRTNNRGFYGVFGGTGLQGVTSATEGAYWQNTYDPEAEWGPAFHDVRHNFIFSSTYELPFGQGRAFGSGGLIRSTRSLATGAWRHLPGAHGLPITVMDGRARSLQGERGSERPNCVGDPHPSDQSIDGWLDINAFQAAPLGTFGNCPVGVVRAPGYTNLDVMFSKRVDMREFPLWRVQDRDLQRAEPPELWSAGARHLGPEQLRQNHQYHQRATGDRAGLQVLFLDSRA